MSVTVAHSWQLVLHSVPQIRSVPCFLVDKLDDGFGEDCPDREGFPVTLP